MDLQLTAVFRKVPEGYIGFIEELPGANTQGASAFSSRELPDKQRAFARGKPDAVSTRTFRSPSRRMPDPGPGRVPPGPALADGRARDGIED